MAEPQSLGQEVRQALEATKPPKPSVSWRSAVVIILCVTTTSLIAVAALWQWGTTKSEQYDDLKAQAAVNAAQQECRSAIAADDAVAQANKQLTSQRFMELAGALVLARDDSLPDEEQAAWRAAAQNIRGVFLDDIEASQVRYEQSLRRSQVNELCADGHVPEPQVQPLPVEPIVQLPPDN